MQRAKRMRWPIAAEAANEATQTERGEAETVLSGESEEDAAQGARTAAVEGADAAVADLLRLGNEVSSGPLTELSDHELDLI